MIIVVDASAAIEMALNLESADLFRSVIERADIVIAPDTYPSEICNVFWKYRTYNDLDSIKCEKGIDYCIDLIDDYIETKFLCREVFGESIKNNHPVYDVFYLVLARRHNAMLITKDKKMTKIALEMKLSLIEIG
jgi:predicted nucleic acid-binding protein